MQLGSLQIGSIGNFFSTGKTVALEDKDRILFINTSELLAFKSHYGKAICYTKGGKYFASKSYSEMVKLVSTLEGWVHTASGLRVNLNRIVSIFPQPSNNYDLVSDCEQIFPLNPAYYENVRKYYKVRTLKHVTPMSLPQYWKIKLNIREIEKNIMYMTISELKENFSTASGSEIVVSDLISNFLFQQAEYIRNGNPSPIEGGNVRSLWYMIKPTLSRLGLIDGTDHYKTLSSRMAEMVTHKILSYGEFKLYDYGRWNVGLYNPHIILLAEKDSHFQFLQQMQDYAGVSIFASGGQPSMMSCEYFMEKFKKKVPEYWLPDRVVIISLVDYDPHGYLIQDTFVDNLRVFGVKHPTQIKLSIPKNYKKIELEFSHINLIKEEADLEDKILKKWLKKTDGINGNPWGMEVDVMMLDRPRVRKLFLTAAKDWFKINPPVKRKIWEEVYKII